MKIALIILTRNEKPCLEVILPQIPPAGPDAGYDYVCGIDGGSTDGTLDVYAQYNVPVISQSNRGRGQAFHEAFARVPDVDAYLFFSPDGNESIADLKKFKPLLEQGADLVIASRMMKDSVNEEDAHLLKWRKWANNAFNLMVNIAFRKKGPYVTDSINGFRAIKRDQALQLQLTANDYTIEYQMTIRSMKHKYTIVEFPTIEGQRIAGDSGAPSIPTGIKFLKRFWSELTNN
jgi:glycosyltransferase involved in cell wall biosynthesis